MTGKPEKLRAYYFGCLLVYVREEFMRKRKKNIYIYIYSILDLVLLVFGTEIISDKDQLNCVLINLNGRHERDDFGKCV